MAKIIAENTLFYGDNLDILRDYLIDECVDLIYLDPPFNSSRNYNVLLKDEHGIDSEAQIVTGRCLEECSLFKASTTWPLRTVHREANRHTLGLISIPIRYTV